MYSRDELFLRSLECDFGVYKYNLSWALKQFVTQVHILFSIYIISGGIEVTVLWRSYNVIHTWNIHARTFSTQISNTWMFIYFSDARDVIFWVFCRCHACWCPRSLSRQGISRHGIGSMGQATYRVAPFWIWSLLNQIIDIIRNVNASFVIFKIVDHVKH